MAKTKAQADELRKKVELLEGPDEGTVIRFEYTFDKMGQLDDDGKKIKRRYYLYSAVWAGDQWFVTGDRGGLDRSYSNLKMIELLASERCRRAEVAVVFEPFKS